MEFRVSTGIDCWHWAGACLSQVLENLHKRKAIFSLSVSTYTSETSCMKGTTVHIKNIVYML